MLLKNSFSILILAGSLLTPRLAEAEFDVVPYNDGGTIVTGGHDDFEPDPNLANNEFQRVFGYEFGEEPTAPYVIEDPGFNNEPGFTVGYGTQNGALLPNVALSFSLLTNLQYWDGTGSVAFGAAPPLVALGMQNVVTMDEIRISGTAANGTVPTIEIANVSGRVHDHVLTSLYYNGESNPAIAPDAPDGVYLIGISLTQAGLAPSDSIYHVFLNNVGGGLGTASAAEGIHETAIDWVQNNLVPEPTSIGLLGMSLLAGIAMTRRGISQRLRFSGQFTK